MAFGNELIIKGYDQQSNAIEYSIKNINPAVPVATLRNTALTLNDLTKISLRQIIYRQDVDITTAN